MSKDQMTSADAAWLHMDRPTNLMVVNSVLWFDEPMNLDRARDVIRERLVERFPRFRQRVVEPRLGVGVPSWEASRASISTGTFTTSPCLRRAISPRCTG